MFSIRGLGKSYIGFAVIHFILFVLAIAVCGVYGSDIQYARNNDKGVGSQWVYSVVVGALSAVTCLIYFVPLFLEKLSLFMAIWDAILFILWIALFGVFGKMYIHADPKGDRDVERMKNAVWVDLTSALLWLIVAVATSVYWFKNRTPARTRWSGSVKA